MRKQDYKETLQSLTLISQMGISIITPIFMGLFLGQYLDKKLNFNGFFSIVFMVIGTCAGFLNIFKLSIGIGKKRKWLYG